MAEVVLFVEWFNSCCYDIHNNRVQKSQDQLVKEKAHIGNIWLGDEYSVSSTGDDWDDAPSCANAGRPYKARCIPIVLGKPLMTKTLEKI